MKRFLSLAASLLVFSAHGWCTWSLSQVKDTVNCSSPCAVSVTSTGSGHLLVAGIIGSASNTTISSVTSAACSSTWTHATNAAAGQAASGSVDLYYCTNSASGQTSISITAGGGGCSSNCVGVISEASATGTIAVDSGATPSGNRVQSTSCTSPCAGTSLTLSGNNDFVAALSGCGSSCTGVSGTGWVNDVSNPNTDGVAHLLNNTATSLTAPGGWTESSSGTMSMDAIAFQETGGSTAGSNKQRKVDQMEGIIR